MLHSQNHKFHTKSTLKNYISTQKAGMIMLGSWATSNKILGIIVYYRSDNTSKYFHKVSYYMETREYWYSRLDLLYSGSGLCLVSDYSLDFLL
jgi:trehalose-6-phosphate synthase